MTATAKKHPCPDCKLCQWCAEERCRLCLAVTSGCRRKLSIAEQIARYEQLNRGESNAEHTTNLSADLSGCLIES